MRNFCKGTLENDVAVLTLSLPLTYTSRVAPIPIATSDMNPTGTCIAVGWGNLRSDHENPEYPKVLQKVELDILDMETCGEFMENPITVGMLCGHGHYKELVPVTRGLDSSAKMLEIIST